MFREKFAQLLMTTLFTLCLALVSSSALAEKEDLKLIDGIDNPIRAPLLLGITGWINSDPIKLSDLNGKVVLIEFWAATCPFCRRAQPTINDWYQKYRKQGLLIIGVHSPQPGEDTSAAGVQDAVNNLHIHYPVALDPNFETWDSYGAEGWPTFFLIDKKGDVVYSSSGAQAYDTIENNIQYLLSH